MYLMAKNWLGRTRKVSVWMWALVCLVLLTVFQVRTHHLDDRLSFSEDGCTERQKPTAL